MKLAKVCLVVSVLLFTYLVLFNFELMETVYAVKEKVGIYLPANIFDKGNQNMYEAFANDAQERFNASFEPTGAVFPFYDTYEAMIAHDALGPNSNNAPSIPSCQYLGIRKKYYKAAVPIESLVPKCRRAPLTDADCKSITKSFGKLGSIRPGKCRSIDAAKLCTMTKSKEKRDEFEVSCDTSPCRGKKLALGLFSDQIGKVKWQTVKDTPDLNDVLKKHVSGAKYAPGFALVKCESAQGIQVLDFPKILKRAEPQQDKKKRFNINIVVEDAFSYPHFYRTLFKTAATFRDIIYNQSIPSTLLEFEKTQGYASNTYFSLQRLFTAQKYLGSLAHCEKGLVEYYAKHKITGTSCTYGVEEMFAKYKEAGYSTFLQEDHCWYDNWASFMDPRRRLGGIKDENVRLSRWKDFMLQVQNSGRWNTVDDYGISLLTCDVLKQYKVTNPFSSHAVPNVCFAGRHYADIFLEYLKEYTQINDEAEKPFIAYTHMLTSHDGNGKRVANDDESLSKFFRHAAHLRNTLTIFASDHGGKSTSFGAYTKQGRQEVFQPLLFMIIPHDVSKALGPEVMNALVVNQNRLVGLEDLQNFMVSHVDPKKPPLGGLFQPIPLNRTCEDMRLNSDVACLCEGMDKTILNTSHTVLWAAEVALGFLNNKIQEQYIASLKSEGAVASAIHGYGACQRYSAIEVSRARHFTSDKQSLIFSLTVKAFDRSNPEIFDIDLSFPLLKNSVTATLNSFVRVSPYNKYEKCADKDVDPKLCTCHQTNKTLWRNRLPLGLTSLTNFGYKSVKAFLDSPCLGYIRRCRSEYVGGAAPHDVVVIHEAFNDCEGVSYKLTVAARTKSSLVRMTPKLPFTVTLYPKSVMFLTAAENEWKYGRFVPKFTFVKTKLTDKKL